MTYRETAILAIKITGLYIIIQAINYLGLTGVFFNTYSALSRDGTLSPVSMFFVFASIAILFLMGVLLVLRAEKMAEWLLDARRRSDKVSTVTSVSPEYLQAVALSIVGVLLIVQTLPDLFPLLFSQYSLMKETGIVQFDLALPLIRHVIQLALGIFLFAGSKNLVRLWYFLWLKRRSKGRAA